MNIEPNAWLLNLALNHHIKIFQNFILNTESYLQKLNPGALLMCCAQSVKTFPKLIESFHSQYLI